MDHCHHRTVEGVPLEPGERVIAYERPPVNHGPMLATIMTFVLLGPAVLVLGAIAVFVGGLVITLVCASGALLLLAVMAGLLFLAARAPRPRARALAITTYRAITVGRDGRVDWVRWGEVTGLAAERREGADGEMGLVANVVFAGLEMIVNAAADRRSPADPAFWSGASAILLQRAARPPLCVPSSRSAELGPSIARAIADPRALQTLPEAPFAP
ncbi:MAG: hypothetical protein IT372_17015 [Polyangiaceae bacterium]|nr:hypothetical protein [Polyangiaceae bacterium]